MRSFDKTSRSASRFSESPLPLGAHWGISRPLANDGAIGYHHLDGMGDVERDYQEFAAQRRWTWHRKLGVRYGMGYKVMQIETSNYCSLKCIYCPHPTQHRPKGDMTFETFSKCMTLVKRSDNPIHRDNRKFVWLNHFGEPLLNPLLPDFIAFATSCGVKVSFASNGLDEDSNLFPQSLWRQLASAGLEVVMLSAHKRSERVLREHIGGIVDVRWMWTPRKGNFHDWAGQVDMRRFKLVPREKPLTVCDYATNHMFAVTWDGRLAACCYDSEGRVGLSVDDVLEDGFEFREISLCSSCRLGRGDASWLLDF